MYGTRRVDRGRFPSMTIRSRRQHIIARRISNGHGHTTELEFRVAQCTGQNHVLERVLGPLQLGYERVNTRHAQRHVASSLHHDTAKAQHGKPRTPCDGTTSDARKCRRRRLRCEPICAALLRRNHGHRTPAVLELLGDGLDSGTRCATLFFSTQGDA